MHRRSTRRWTLFLLMAAITGAFGLLYQPAVVLGNSMFPTLASGRVIWVERGYYRHRPPQRGEVVVFRHQGQTYVKRVYRGPGETVFALMRGEDWVGPIREAQVPAMRRRYATGKGGLHVRALKVPARCVFVLGDNFNNSVDSRHLGLVPIRTLLGRAAVETDATATLRFELRPVEDRSRQGSGRHAAPLHGRRHG